MKKVICKIENNSVEPKMVTLFGRLNHWEDKWTKPQFQYKSFNDLIITYNDKLIKDDLDVYLFNDKKYETSNISIATNHGRQLRQEVSLRSGDEHGQSCVIPLNYTDNVERVDLYNGGFQGEAGSYMHKIKFKTTVNFNKNVSLGLYVLPKTNMVIEMDVVEI